MKTTILLSFVDEIQNEEHLDAEFIWSVKMLTEVSLEPISLYIVLLKMVILFQIILCHY